MLVEFNALNKFWGNIFLIDWPFDWAISGSTCFFPMIHIRSRCLSDARTFSRENFSVNIFTANCHTILPHGILSVGSQEMDQLYSTIDEFISNNLDLLPRSCNFRFFITITARGSTKNCRRQQIFQGIRSGPARRLCNAQWSRRSVLSLTWVNSN